MPRTKAALAAVDIIDNELIYLQLSTERGNVFIHQWHKQKANTASNKGLDCRELMTVMEHRASHYQRLTQPSATDNVTSFVHETYGGTADYTQDIVLDYQYDPTSAHVISAHSSQVKKRQQLFAQLAGPLSIVEPAFQAILRATNFLLGQGELITSRPCEQWLIVELSHPLSTCIFCHHGCLDRLQFVAESELHEVITNSPLTLYFGDKTKFSETTQNLLNTAIELQLPKSMGDFSSAVGSTAAISLFGNALRGFSSWHH